MNKHNRKKIWKWIVSIGVVLAIPAAIAEISGYSLINLFNNETSVDSNTILVKVKSQNKIPLPSKGKVYITYGNAQIGKEINNHNEAIFTEVPHGYFVKGNYVKIEFIDVNGEPYYSIHEDSLYQLMPNQSIEIQVNIKGLDKIYGIVKDFESGKYIEDAKVNVLNMVVHTDSNGWWELLINDEDKKRKFHTVRVSKKGYKNWEENNIPAQTEKEIISLLIPVK